ncbi:MAG: hypothetical protein HeimC2_21120 [Candidatus Heimdallarchaeota archaeon LC_2]|nr:MAG: hypothetical protein HeimC2_21120 [Candidatus Heimdallarchaeota archaeon LC_2]
MKNYRDEIKKYSTSIVEMEIGEIAMKEFNEFVTYREKMGHALSLSELEEIGVFLLEEAERHYKKLFVKLRSYHNENQND